MVPHIKMVANWRPQRYLSHSGIYRDQKPAVNDHKGLIGPVNYPSSSFYKKEASKQRKSLKVVVPSNFSSSNDPNLLNSILPQLLTCIEKFIKCAIYNLNLIQLLVFVIFANRLMIAGKR